MTCNFYLFYVIIAATATFAMVAALTAAFLALATVKGVRYGEGSENYKGEEYVGNKVHFSFGEIGGIYVIR